MFSLILYVQKLTSQIAVTLTPLLSGVEFVVERNVEPRMQLPASIHGPNAPTQAES